MGVPSASRRKGRFVASTSVVCIVDVLLGCEWWSPATGVETGS
jgi:hypothetical protein